MGLFGVHYNRDPVDFDDALNTCKVSSMITGVSVAVMGGVAAMWRARSLHPDLMKRNTLVGPAIMGSSAVIGMLFYYLAQSGCVKTYGKKFPNEYSNYLIGKPTSKIPANLELRAEGRSDPGGH
ncbi:hypothetical protein HK101_010845 [Irineochytrium annulatum]|nr:hypothetical protein HK101_010845 [Irineochytrium annulatum]